MISCLSLSAQRRQLHRAATACHLSDRHRIAASAARLRETPTLLATNIRFATCRAAAPGWMSSASIVILFRRQYQRGAAWRRTDLAPHSTTCCLNSESVPKPVRSSCATNRLRERVANIRRHPSVFWRRIYVNHPPESSAGFQLKLCRSVSDSVSLRRWAGRIDRGFCEMS